MFEPSRVDSFFDFRHGLLLNTTLPDGHCNLESDAIAAARAFYLSRYLLAALMLYELATMRNLHWSVLLHHVVSSDLAQASLSQSALE